MSVAVGYQTRQFFDQHRSRLVILFVLAVVIWFLLAFAEQAWRARQLQAEAAQQRVAIATIAERNAELQAQLDAYGTDVWLDYAQSRARRDLNLANPGETVLMVRWGQSASPDSTEPAPAAVESNSPNWRTWVDVFSPD